MGAFLFLVSHIFFLLTGSCWSVRAPILTAKRSAAHASAASQSATQETDFSSAS
jgi:hypothetical protein